MQDLDFHTGTTQPMNDFPQPSPAFRPDPPNNAGGYQERGGAVGVLGAIAMPPGELPADCATGRVPEGVPQEIDDGPTQDFKRPDEPVVLVPNLVASNWSAAILAGLILTAIVAVLLGLAFIAA